MGTLLQDVQFALRTLRRTPAFPLAAIATLAIGIGASTAIFSTVNAVLLKPLPYPHAEDLYALRTALTDGRVTLVAAYLAGRVVSSQLYQVSASDPVILGAATVVVMGITLVATVIPAWRASRLDPARVLWPE